jgi:transcription elongation factor Elf1
MKPNLYFPFYNLGRDEYEGAEGVVLDALSKRVLAGEPLRTVVEKAIIASLTTDLDRKFKADWIADNVEDIKEAGGDTEKAWGLYFAGACDAGIASLLNELADNTASVLDEQLDEGEDGDEDDEDDEDDEEEDEEEEEGEDGEAAE